MAGVPAPVTWGGASAIFVVLGAVGADPPNHTDTARGWPHGAITGRYGRRIGGVDDGRSGRPWTCELAGAIS